MSVFHARLTGHPSLHQYEWQLTVDQRLSWCFWFCGMKSEFRATRRRDNDKHPSKRIVWKERNLLIIRCECVWKRERIATPHKTKVRVCKESPREKRKKKYLYKKWIEIKWAKKHSQNVNRKSMLNPINCERREIIIINSHTTAKEEGKKHKTSEWARDVN